MTHKLSQGTIWKVNFACAHNIARHKNRSPNNQMRKENTLLSSWYESDSENAISAAWNFEKRLSFVFVDWQKTISDYKCVSESSKARIAAVISRGCLDPVVGLLAKFVQSTLEPWEGAWSRAGRRRISPHSGESRDRLFILRFNFCRLGECGATTFHYRHHLPATKILALCVNENFMH